MGILSKLKKFKRDRPILFDVYNFYLTDVGAVNFKADLKLIAFIPRLENFFDTLLENPDTQKFWKEIKERFGKDVDEQELLKVFKFYILLNVLGLCLEHAWKRYVTLEDVTESVWVYYLYRNKNMLNGKLDEKTFKELIKKIWNLAREFYEKDNQNKEQKDEQPK
jgi:hypothetical protein